MSRLIREESISGASDFYSEQEGMRYCAEAIAYNSDAVRNWFYSGPNDQFPNGSDYDKLVLTEKTYHANHF